MKKVFFVAALAFAVASCGNKAESVEATQVDSTEVAVDSTVVEVEAVEVEVEAAEEVVAE